MHVVGKGVIRFHAVYWPAMLLSAGVPLPTDIVVHGYITLQGRKLSKTLGNVVDPAQLVSVYGVNAVRYYLLADLSPFGDGDFSEERLLSRYNTDLANGLGNLVSRVTSMIGRYRNGVVPSASVAGQADKSLAAQVQASDRASGAAMDSYDHREALARIWDLVRGGNAYIDERAPWHLAKNTDDDSSQLLDTTLNYLATAIRQLGAMLAPFMPDAADTILGAVGETTGTAPPASRWLEGIDGRAISKPASVFPRFEMAE